MTTATDFTDRTDRYRRELLAHCYRMTASVHDAEDLVQETYLRAWRSFSRFDDRKASMRTWLYRIAHNACLTALEQRGRRPLPSGLGAPETDPTTPLDRLAGVAWVQPIPGALLGDGAASAQRGAVDPASVVVSRESVRLAFVAALQHLPPRQRAVLLLRDVLGWPAAEVAMLLGTTSAGVNSALQRARSQLVIAAPVEDQVVEPTAADDRELIDRYVAAFENADVAAIERLLRDDVELEMPPAATWFRGRDAVGTFLRSRAIAPYRWRMLRTRANGGDAVAAYLGDADGRFHAHSIQVCSVVNGRIAHIHVFQDEALFPTFGLPMTVR